MLTEEDIEAAKAVVRDAVMGGDVEAAVECHLRSMYARQRTPDVTTTLELWQEMEKMNLIFAEWFEEVKRQRALIVGPSGRIDA